MKQALQELLQNQGGNYILPFFWQHGEEEAVLRDYMRAIHQSNIGAVCVEARPHPDFAGPGWWHDMDIILDEARTRGMRVWVLDDAHFPTGFANGAMKEADESLCKLYLDVALQDISGPTPQASLQVDALLSYSPGMPNPLAHAMGGGEPRVFGDGQLVSVLACRRTEDVAVDAPIDLTDKVKDGRLVWDVPAGLWRVYVVYTTRNGGGRTDYINMLDAASCRVQIDAVYEPHWQHYKDDFGKTLAGFFSDEPAVGNTFGFKFDESIGRKKMPLPWSSEMPGLMQEALGAGWQTLLPALWADMGDANLYGRVRYAYMDAATRLIRDNFAGQIGRWCEAHGVEYIGHIIEDNNQHARLGSSMGHFFRAMEGQHMSGIDDIGNQVLPGGEYTRRKALVEGFMTDGDGEFYHFALGKLGASLAHIDPKKKGRAMCEIFGAYGWGEGVKLMKYLTDHFLVRGINYYVPHAFSPKAFPDPDCPPHFYAHGENPQFGRFGVLMQYMNRMCHLLQNGLHVAPVALLYHGEAEWAGEHMLLQKPARALLEHQIDFDILPADVFANGPAFNAGFNGTLSVNGEQYQTLVVPYARFLPLAVLEFAAMAAGKGFPVVFVGALPQGASNSTDTKRVDAAMEGLAKAKVVPLEALPQAVHALGIADVLPETPFTHLRYYHYRRDGVDSYLLLNESQGDTYEGSLWLRAQGPVTAYDAMENQLYAMQGTPKDGGTQVQLALRPGESRVLVFADMGSPPPLPAPPRGDAMPIGRWTVALCDAKAYPAFGPAKAVDALDDLGTEHPNFAGYARYEAVFSLETLPKRATLVLQAAHEAPQVWVNGEDAGIRLAAPYEFEVGPLLKVGQNSLRVEIASTLQRKVTAMMANVPNPFNVKGGLVEPTGLVGQVALVCEW